MNEHRMRREAIARGESDPGPSASTHASPRLKRGELRVVKHVADAHAWNVAHARELRDAGWAPKPLNRAQRRGGR